METQTGSLISPGQKSLGKKRQLHHLASDVGWSLAQLAYAKA